MSGERLKKGMFPVKFKTKMLVLILLPVIIAIGILGGYSFWTAKGILEEQIYQSNQIAIENFSRQLNESLVRQESVAKNLAAVLSDHVMDDQEMKLLADSTKRSDPDEILNVIFGFEDKRYIDSDGFNPPASFDVRARDWYKEVMASDTIKYTSIYHSAYDDKLMTNAGIPIVRNGTKIGVAAVDIDLEKLFRQTKEMKINDASYVFVLNANGDFIVHPEFNNGENIRDVKEGALAGFFDQLQKEGTVTKELSVDGTDSLYSALPLGNTGWTICTAVDMNELFAPVRHMAMALITGSVLVLAFLIWAILRLTLQTTKLLNQIVAVIERFAAGDFTLQERTIFVKDEFGKIVEALVHMRRNIHDLVYGIGGSAEQLAEASKELTETSDQSAQVSQQIASSVTNVAQIAQEQFHAVERSNQAVATSSQLLMHLKDNAMRVGERISTAASEADHGNKEMADAILKMEHIEKTVGDSALVIEQLGEQSKEIGDIVSTISSIAGQTNLLALNAAIEAARAGEQGRGFAVVAEEVRKLAEQSQAAAQNIAVLIQKVQAQTSQAVASMQIGTKEVREGSDVVQHSGAVFKEIYDHIIACGHELEAAHQAMSQMEENTKKVMDGAEKLDGLSKSVSGETQTVSAATEQQAAALQQMSSASQGLASLAQKLQNEVGKFKV